MGNVLGGKKRAVKVMKVDGTTLKLKPPVTAREALQGHPAGFVILDAEDVKLLGTRSKPIAPEQLLKPKKLYFLVELPKEPAPSSLAGRRVQSGVNMSAKDRLETLMLKRRAESDITSLVRVPAGEGPDANGNVRLRLRLPKAQVAKLVEETSNSGEAAEKILEYIKQNKAQQQQQQQRFSGALSGEITSSGELGLGPGRKREKKMRFAQQEAEIIG